MILTQGPPSFAEFSSACLVVSAFDIKTIHDRPYAKTGLIVRPGILKIFFHLFPNVSNFEVEFALCGGHWIAG